MADEEVDMPIVRITMLAGRDDGSKRQLLQSVTSAVTSSLGVAADSVRIIIEEIPEDHYGVAGLPIRAYRSAKAGSTDK